MATERQPRGKWVLGQLPTLAVGGAMAALSAYVAYHAVMAALRVVIGAP